MALATRLSWVAADCRNWKKAVNGFRPSLAPIEIGTAAQRHCCPFELALTGWCGRERAGRVGFRRTHLVLAHPKFWCGANTRRAVDLGFVWSGHGFATFRFQLYPHTHQFATIDAQPLLPRPVLP